MSDEIQKLIIRVIQDQCHVLDKEYLVNEFATTIAPLISKHIENNILTHTLFLQICKKRKDFFYANDVSINDFSRILYLHLKNELSYYVFNTFDDLLIEYKRRMENGSLRGFPKGTKEDTLRCDLSNYIKFENFCEPRCGSGNCDIIIPTKKTIIETKLWKGKEYFNSGLPELDEYLSCQKYNKGYYMIFDYTISDNGIIKKCGEIFRAQKTKNSITVIFVRMVKTPPSKIYKSKQNELR